METFGEWLQHQRSLRRLTREEFAKRIGCSVSALRKIEYGERRPSAQIAELMANCLDVPVEERSIFVRVARGELRVDYLHPESKPVATANISSPKTNLPIFPTPLIGREHELQQLSQLLRDPQCRLLTLVGPGGIGKTRLAIETVSSMRDAFADGVYFIPLASVGSTDAVISTTANAIHFAFYGPRDPKVQLLNYLREKQMLLIVDNLEHLLVGRRPHEETVVELLIEMLQQAAQLKLLCTSRESLGLQEEWVFEVQGLPVPENISAEGSAKNTSVELFLQRARRAHVRFNATPEDFPPIVRICQLVDGMPLGIELAAAWVQTLSCDEIVSELEHGLDFLSASTRHIPTRHRSMRAVFDHSWKLLTEEEQGLLLRLSVFRGGMQREAAEAIAGATLSLLSTLQSKSFLRRMPTGRYDLHELVHQYVADRLAQVPEEEREVRDRHSAYYTDYVARLEGELKGAEQLQARAALDAEIDNIRAGWRWAVRTRELAAVRKPVRTLWYFYEMHSWFQEAEDSFAWAADEMDTALQPGNADDGAKALRAYLRALLGWFYLRRGKLEKAELLLESSLASLRSFDIGIELADVLYYAGAVAWMSGNYPRARVYFIEELAVAEQFGNQWDIGLATGNIGLVAQTIGEYEEAQQCWQTALAIERRLGDQRMVAAALHFSGMLKRALGAHAEAQARLRECLALSGSVGERWLYGMALSQLGLVTQELGDHAEAVGLLNESVALLRELEEHWSLLHALIGLGAATLAIGDYAESRAAYSEALTMAHQRQALPEVLESMTGMARWSAQQGAPEQALVSVFFVLNHPAATEQTKEAARQLRAELETQLTPSQIEAIQGHAGEKTFEAVVEDLLK